MFELFDSLSDSLDGSLLGHRLSLLLSALVPAQRPRESSVNRSARDLFVTNLCTTQSLHCTRFVPSSTAPKVCRNPFTMSLTAMFPLDFERWFGLNPLLSVIA